MLCFQNMGLLDLNVGAYYFVISDAQSNIFLGSQDQGFQRALNTIASPGPLAFNQVISGDYGKLQLTRNGQTLWTEYPGGRIYNYYNSTGPVSGYFILTGTLLPVVGWMLATAPVY